MSKGFIILDGTEETGWNKHGKPATLRLAKNGMVGFSINAVKLLGLTPGMRINFMFHPDDPEIFYFFQDIKGVQLLKGNKVKEGNRLFCCCNKHVVKLLEHFRHSGLNRTFKVTEKTAEVNGKLCWFVLRSNLHITKKTRKNV